MTDDRPAPATEHQAADSTEQPPAQPAIDATHAPHNASAHPDPPVGASRAPPLCHKCGQPKSTLSVSGHPLASPHCRPCLADAQRRSRHRRSHARRSRTLTAIRRRTEAAALREALQAALRSYGGWEALRAALGPSETADLLVRLDEAQLRAEQQAQEADRRHRPRLDDPALQRDLQRMGIEHLAEHPEALAPHLAGILARRPSLLTPELLDAPAVRSWLSRNGWTRESD